MPQQVENYCHRSGSQARRSCLFYKLILPSILHHKKMKITKKFVKKYGNELSTVATLTVPNEKIWLVGLTKADNRIWFHDNWHEFLEHYSIGVGCFLVFIYEGNSNFNVCVYNLTGYNMKYPLNTVSSIEKPHHDKQFPVLEDAKDDDSVEILGSSPPWQTPSFLKSKSFDVCVDKLTLDKSYNPTALHNLFNGPKLKKCINLSDEANLNQSNGADDSKVAVQSTRDIGVQVDGIELNNSADDVTLHFSDEENRRLAKTTRKKQKIDISSDEQESSALHEEEAKMLLRCYESASTRKRTVTNAEREKAIDAAKAFEPVSPSCRVVLRPSYLYKGCIMYVPHTLLKNI